jgi:hypothetical protein
VNISAESKRILRKIDYICSPFPREMQQATLAQSVEQRIRNAQVVSSSLMSGSSKKREIHSDSTLFLSCILAGIS